MPLIFIGNNNRLSHIVAGKQVADYIKAPWNPKTISKDDTMISFEYASIISNIDNKLYLHSGDLLKGSNDIEDILRKATGLIVENSLIRDYYLRNGFRNLTLIPHHHCNFENIVHEKKDRPFTVGYAGSICGIDYNLSLLGFRLFKEGIEFVCLFCDDDSRSREVVCDFYGLIDAQVSFRKEQETLQDTDNGKAIFTCALKVTNGCAFGVPTVAYPSTVYKNEFDGYFLEAFSIQDIVDQCKKLRDEKSLYEDLSNKGLGIAKKYHISKTSQLYLELD